MRTTSGDNTSAHLDMPLLSDDLLLFCGEDAGELDSLDGGSSDLSVLEEDEEVVMALMAESEGKLTSRFLSHDPVARRQSVDWILKVSFYYRFCPLTPYLAISYMDRFLSNHDLSQKDGWPMQLLSVACLSLAAKMEETLVPSLLDLQVEGTRFILEPRTVCRMELLVLTALNWRLRSVTPFDFLDFFARKIDSGTKRIGYLTSHASRLILQTIRDVQVLEYYPSAMAAAAVVCATDEIPDLSFIVPETTLSWCSGLAMDDIMSCYKLMHELVSSGNQLRRPHKILPKQRATTKHDMSSGVCSSASSNKRRKINNMP